MYIYNEPHVASIHVLHNLALLGGGSSHVVFTGLAFLPPQVYSGGSAQPGSNNFSSLLAVVD